MKLPRNPAAIGALLALSVSVAESLIIYRIGGEGMDPPSEAGQQDIDFIQVGWEDLDPDLGGETFDLDMSSVAVRALRRDPRIDIAPTAEERGGIFIRPNVNGEVWDNDTTTVWAASRYLCAEIAEGNYFLYCTDDFGTEGTANIDLGGLFQIDRIRVVSGLRDPAKTVQALRVFIALEMPYTSVTHHPRPWSPWIVEVRDNREQILDIPIPPHDDVGYVQVTLGEHDTEWDVHDIQIYAKGFAPRSTYTANIIDFGEVMAWGELRWGGASKGSGQRSRSSRAAGPTTPLFFSFASPARGEEKEPVTLSEYNRLSLGEKAGFTEDLENWSFWNSYDFSDSLGTQIVSPGPRQLTSSFSSTSCRLRTTVARLLSSSSAPRSRWLRISLVRFGPLSPGQDNRPSSPILCYRQLLRATRGSTA